MKPLTKIEKARNVLIEFGVPKEYIEDLEKEQAQEFEKMIEEWNIIYDNGTSFFEKKDGSFRTNSGEVFVKELLSQLNSKGEEKQDEN